MEWTPGAGVTPAAPRAAVRTPEVTWAASPLYDTASWMDDAGLARMLAGCGCELRRRRGAGIRRTINGGWIGGMLRLLAGWRGSFVAAFLVGALPGHAGFLHFLFYHVGRAA